MRKILAGLVGAWLVCLAPAHGAEYGTRQEAAAMATAAAQLLKEKGPEALSAAVVQNPGPFRDRDLYVYVLTLDGTMFRHPISPALEGKNLTNLRDVDGKLFIQEILALKEPGWVNYKWRNPTTNAVESKTTYSIKQGDYWVLVGAYRTE
jgi:cytochrome c